MIETLIFDFYLLLFSSLFKFLFVSMCGDSV